MGQVAGPAPLRYTPGMLKLSALLLFLPFLSLAQLTPNSITVTASRNVNPPPDLARFNVSVNAGIDATREDVLAAVAGAGVKAADFTGVSGSSFSSNGLSVNWMFSMTAPLANLKPTIGLLTAVQNDLSK